MTKMSEYQISECQRLGWTVIERLPEEVIQKIAEMLKPANLKIERCEWCEDDDLLALRIVNEKRIPISILNNEDAGYWPSAPAAASKPCGYRAYWPSMGSV